jgi:hypothetical protein
MKPQLKAVIGKVILGTSLLMTLVTAKAQTVTPAPADGQSENATVKYLGTQDDMVVFNVSYSNPDGSRFMLIVKDQDGSPMYSNSFNDRSFYRQFRLPKTDKDRIIFVFRDGHDADVVKTFEINVNSRFVREVAIKKVD